MRFERIDSATHRCIIDYADYDDVDEFILTVKLVIGKDAARRVRIMLKSFGKLLEIDGVAIPEFELVFTKVC